MFGGGVITANMAAEQRLQLKSDHWISLRLLQMFPAVFAATKADVFIQTSMFSNSNQEVLRPEPNRSISSAVTRKKQQNIQPKQTQTTPLTLVISSDTERMFVSWWAAADKICQTDWQQKPTYRFSFMMRKLFHSATTSSTNHLKIHKLYAENCDRKWENFLHPSLFLDQHWKLTSSNLWWKSAQWFLFNPADEPTNKRTRVKNKI